MKKARRWGLLFAAAAPLLTGTAFAAPLPARTAPTVIPDAAVARFAVPSSHEPFLSRSAKIKRLRSKVKYVFVLYQENRSFDSYFGTFPGADGLFSHRASKTPGFTQTLIDTDGTTTTVHPFRIGPAQYAADLDDIDHGHPSIVRKMDIVKGQPKMDRFAVTEELRFTNQGNPSLKAKQYGELAMAYEDGDTIPFLWRYANRFVLFDHIFQQMTGPSTPGNLAIIGAQVGATQWMRHPEQAYKGSGVSGPGVPVFNDADPFWSLPLDRTTGSRPPTKPGPVVQYNLTYATLPLTLAGKTASQVTKADPDPAGDLGDVAEDVAGITASHKAAVPWGWYEEGFDREPTDPAGVDPVDAEGTHASYITHHNGPQYFGYIANNPRMSANLHGLQDFFGALDRHTLPARGGVFYVKGGSKNILGLKPADPDAQAQTHYLGDDDHPGYSDLQISEAQIAHIVNKIAAGPYWKDCAIIVTWDDSEGDYDHVPPPVRSVGPDGSVTTDGPRVPLLLISPYARVGTVAHEFGDHASVVKFVDTVFGLTPLADLPDERKGRRIGEARGLAHQGPYDDKMPHVTDLLSAFDPARLTGRAPALPASYAQIPEALLHTLPQQSGYGWRQIGVMPTDYRKGISNEIPADFNPRPGTNPTPAPSAPGR